MADFGDDLDIEGDVLAANRSHEDGDTSGGEFVPEKRRRGGAYHKPKPPTKQHPQAVIQLSPALQSELRKLQQVATRGAGV